MSLNYFTLLDLITEKGPISQKSIIRKYRFVEKEEIVKKLLKCLVEQGDILSRKKRYEYYYIAPAQLILNSQGKYRLIGHPGANNILKNIGELIFLDHCRLFKSFVEKEILDNVCTDYGITIRR